jgi:hypothetical protein
MIKDINVTEVIESKVYVKPGSAISFGSPKRYLEPFIEYAEAKAVSFRVKVADPIINAEEEGRMNIAYPRVMIEANLGNLIEGFDAIVGMMYALDLQKPVVKAYSGFNVQSCLNLTIFNNDRLIQQELLADFTKVYDGVQRFVEEKESEIENFKSTLSKLREEKLSENTFNELVGRLLREGSRTRLGTNPVLQAVKMLDDNSSQYYIRQENKFECSKFNVYNAVTQALTNSNDITDRANKTIQLANIILN